MPITYSPKIHFSEPLVDRFPLETCEACIVVPARDESVRIKPRGCCRYSGTGQTGSKRTWTYPNQGVRKVLRSRFVIVAIPCGSTEAVAAEIQFDVGHYQVIVTPETEIPEFRIVIHERSITTATVAVADHIMNDFPDHKSDQAWVFIASGQSQLPEAGAGTNTKIHE